MYISLIPRHSKIREERLVSSVCTCASPQAFQGTVILVCVAQSYYQSCYKALFIQQLNEAMSCTLSKVVKPGMPVFLCVIICMFSLRISMSYMENVMELLVRARTVDTRHSSLIFLSAWE